MLFWENTLVFHFKGELFPESAGELESKAPRSELMDELN